MILPKPKTADVDAGTPMPDEGSGWDPMPAEPPPEKNAVIVDCGWGRLIFGHTFEGPEQLAEELRAERPGRRDVALYARDPHIVVSLAPQDLFLDPSYTYRLAFADYQPPEPRPAGLRLRAATPADEEAINRIYMVHNMVTAYDGFLGQLDPAGPVRLEVAEDEKTGNVVGAVTGVDHRLAFGDPNNGSSLWALAVDPQAAVPGIGRALVDHLIGIYEAEGRAFLDLSVMYDNAEAIALYEKLGFRKIPVTCIKNKNPINERLFTGPAPEESLNIYAGIIVNEARRRGIAVDIVDGENGYFTLSFGGRTVTCRESLSELTTAVAMSRCDDKNVTHRVLAADGLTVPDQMVAGDSEAEREFLERHRRVVVKPARGEQGRGVFVDLTTTDEVQDAVAQARKHCDKVVLEQYVTGEDLRVIVIDFQVVAAAVRRPPRVQGDGRHTVRELIEKQSRRRSAATDGESTIPLDAETRRSVNRQGVKMDDVLEESRTLAVRKTANLHTGGTIHDVTAELHPAIVGAAVRAARALDIPVVGLDFMVPAVDEPEFVIIEANERPGLANHEPQPTAERFIDLLFPQTRPAASKEKTKT